MFLKSMARKSATFAQLLDYFHAPDAVGVPLFHNLTAAGDLESISAEFLANSHLLPPRKNGNLLYHEILSFASADREKVTPAVVEDLTRRYLEMRAPRALAYAISHWDTDCPHVHVLISANNVASRRRLRLSRQRFRGIQVELENQQNRLYPFLERSRAQARRSRGQPLTRSEQERSRRGDQVPTRKQEVRELVAEAVSRSESGESCYRRLLREGLRLYKRGRSVGVEDLETGRRFRLKSLGLADEFDRAFESWQRVAQLEDDRQGAITRSRDRSRPELER